jgi:hypothetical protein
MTEVRDEVVSRRFRNGPYVYIPQAKSSVTLEDGPTSRRIPPEYQRHFVCVGQ